MQFVEVALLEIPKHGYFYSARHRQEQHDNSKNAVRVTQLLQRLLTEEESDLQKQVTENDLLRVQKWWWWQQPLFGWRRLFRYNHSTDQQLQQLGGHPESSYANIIITIQKSKKTCLLLWMN